MAVVWKLYRFNHARFLQIRPRLRSALLATEFAALADGPDLDAVVEALNEGETDAFSARHDVIIAVCCSGDPLPCSACFPKVLQSMRRTMRAEEGTELLADAIAGGRNLESWLQPGGKLAGYLTSEEVEAVRDAYKKVKTSNHALRSKSGSRVRRGGVIWAIATFFRRLFDRGLAQDELYGLLGEFLDEVVAEKQGIAVINC